MKNLSGKRFGRLMVVSLVETGICREWLCRCDCGNEKNVRGDSLRHGQSKSCGCLQREIAAKQGRESVVDLQGKRFGRLVVASRAGSANRKARWLCRCDCGKEKIVYSQSLIRGTTKSCGCYHREVWQKMLCNPLLTDEERELQRKRRLDPRTIEWRKAVYARDDFLCQACGNSGGRNLVAHHKESWNKNRILRFDVGNGVTVCEKCHKEFHSIFGYGDNTTEDWNMFLKTKGSDSVVFSRPVKRRIRIDLTGKRIGRLMVMMLDATKKMPHWICRCDCGMIKSVDGHCLKRGSVKSCGCLNRERIIETGKNNLNDLSGKRFGRLIAIAYMSKHRWKCVCDCGTERIVDAKFLHNGDAVDCQSQKNGNKCSLRRAA